MSVGANHCGVVVTPSAEGSSADQPGPSADQLDPSADQPGPSADQPGPSAGTATEE